MIEITNINQLLPLVETKPEFVVIDKGEFTVIDYVYQDKNTFDDPLLMECRGIKFDRDGFILARPFRKFFNYGEQGSDLPMHRPHIITEKLDGSMIHPTMLKRRLFFHTRKGHTDVAKKAERHVLSSPNIGYQGFCISILQAGWTPIFEYTGPNNRIVLRYEHEALTLIAIRHTITGRIMSRDGMREWGDSYSIPVVETVTEAALGLGAEVNYPIVDVEEFIKHTRELKDAEGYVIYFDDGYMVKIKAEDYVLKHRALNDLNSKKKVMALCAQGFMDDVLPILSEPDAQELIDFNEALQDEVTVLTMVAEGLASMVTGDEMTRKEWALNTLPKVNPSWLAGVAFGIMDGKNARMLVLKEVQKHYDDINVAWRGE